MLKLNFVNYCLNNRKMRVLVTNLRKECFFTMQGDYLGSLKIVGDLININNSYLTCFPDPSHLGFLNKELFKFNS